MPRAFNGLVWLGFAGALTAVLWAASGGGDPDPAPFHKNANANGHVERCLVCQSRLGVFYPKPATPAPPEVR